LEIADQRRAKPSIQSRSAGKNKSICSECIAAQCGGQMLGAARLPRFEGQTLLKDSAFRRDVMFEWDESTDFVPPKNQTL
jgi:hypothetical protein